MIFYPPADHRLLTLARWRQPLHVVMSPGHSLAKRKILTLREVSEYPLALLVAAHGVQQAIAAEAHKARIQLIPRFSCNSIIALRALAEGFGNLTILPRFAVPELSNRRLVAVPLSEPWFKSTEVDLFAKRTRPLTVVAAELARVLGAGMQAFTERK